MKFFKPEDFKYDSVIFEGNLYIKVGYAANRANEKLEREARVVIGSPETNWDEAGNKIETHKALLVNIELIEKCKHPNDNIKGSMLNVYRDDSNLNKYCFRCECGVQVFPSSFEERK